MKFLGWMHRRLQHNATEPVKNTMMGIPCACLSDQRTSIEFDHNYYIYIEPAKSFPKSQKSYHSLPNTSVEDQSLDPFDFLAIGTFGAELPTTNTIKTTDPPTPKFPTTNQQTQAMTENDVEFMRYKLDKFLELAQDEEEIIAKSASQRSSQASIITLSGKPITDDEGEGADTRLLSCALENYVFGHPDKQAKKERTSLGELFKRGDDYEEEEQPRKRYNDADNLMKKVVKKLHSSSNTKPAAVSTCIKKKLSKAFKMLGKKVHPEEIPKNQNEAKIANVNANQIRGNNQSKTDFQQDNTMRAPSNSTSSKSAPTITGGHWIKTDSDYLVLEL